jgi:hypothetical protein
VSKGEAFYSFGGFPDSVGDTESKLHAAHENLNIKTGLCGCDNVCFL